MTDVSRLYAARFPESDRARRGEIWAALVAGYFQRFVRETDTVLDLGCGSGEFLRAVKCGRRIGIDLDAAARSSLPGDVEFHEGDVRDLPGIGDASVDFVFCSNLLEHLPDKAAVERLLGDLRRKVVPGGHLLVLGPNVRAAPGAYWDFWDHAVPLSDRSLVEVLRVTGWEIEAARARFLPLTTRGAWPSHPWLVRIYLAVPAVWRLFGAQFLVVAKSPGPG